MSTRLNKGRKWIVAGPGLRDSGKNGLRQEQKFSSLTISGVLSPSAHLQPHLAHSLSTPSPVSGFIAKTAAMSTAPPPTATGSSKVDAAKAQLAAHVDPNAPKGLALYGRFAFAGAVCCSVTHGALTPVDVYVSPVLSLRRGLPMAASHNFAIVIAGACRNDDTVPS